jgi:hypothetical protein
VKFGPHYVQDDEIMLLFWELSDDSGRITKNRFKTLLKCLSFDDKYYRSETEGNYVNYRGNFYLGKITGFN